MTKHHDEYAVCVCQPKRRAGLILGFLLAFVFLLQARGVSQNFSTPVGQDIEGSLPAKAPSDSLGSTLETSESNMDASAIGQLAADVWTFIERHKLKKAIDEAQTAKKGADAAAEKANNAAQSAENGSSRIKLACEQMNAAIRLNNTILTFLGVLGGIIGSLVIVCLAAVCWAVATHARTWIRKEVKEAVDLLRRSELDAIRTQMRGALEKAEERLQKDADIDVEEALISFDGIVMGIEERLRTLESVKGLGEAGEEHGVLKKLAKRLHMRRALSHLRTQLRGKRFAENAAQQLEQFGAEAAEVLPDLRRARERWADEPRIAAAIDQAIEAIEEGIDRRS